MVKRLIILAVTGWSVVGCSKDSTAPAPNFSVTFVNRLYVPVTIKAAGVTIATLNGTQSVVIPGGTNSVQWVAGNATFSDGSFIPNDLTGASVLVAAQATITISNVVGGVTYFTPYIDNQTGTSIVVAIAQNGAVTRCLGTQSGSGGTDWGYYVLGSTTEVRIYKPGANCTGAYNYWTTAQLTNGIFGGTGLVLLTADKAP